MAPFQSQTSLSESDSFLATRSTVFAMPDEERSALGLRFFSRTLTIANECCNQLQLLPVEFSNKRW